MYVVLLLEEWMLFCCIRRSTLRWDCEICFVIHLQGAIETISVGEIKLSLRQSLVKLGVGFISRDPKLQILICDLEVTMRPSSKGRPKSSKPRKTRTSGRGKWMVVANIARYLSVSVTDLILKVCKVLRLVFAMLFTIFQLKPTL